MHVYACMCACVCMCVVAYVHMCVRMYVYMQVCRYLSVCVSLCAWRSVVCLWVWTEVDGADADGRVRRGL
jgi:hypothetical protein